MHYLPDFKKKVSVIVSVITEKHYLCTQNSTNYK